jgi:hypothetical protein
MARQNQGSDRSSTVLWIAWTAGGTERYEPLCLTHRRYVYEHYSATASGQGRRGTPAVCVVRRASPRSAGS